MLVETPLCWAIPMAGLWRASAKPPIVGMISSSALATTLRWMVPPLEGHLGVANDGQVHYHAIPNLRFVSTVDLVKQLIEAFPEDFQPRSGGHAHREEP